MNLMNYGECSLSNKALIFHCFRKFVFLSHLNVLVIVKVFCQTQISTEDIAIDNKVFGGYIYHSDAYLIHIWVFGAP